MMYIYRRGPNRLRGLTDGLCRGRCLSHQREQRQHRRTVSTEASYHEAQLVALQDRLEYRFRDRSLLDAALTHTSLLNDWHQKQSTTLRTGVTRERLEFLGDAVLDLVVALHLLDASPGASPGDLSVDRQHRVSNRHLSTVASDLEVHTCIKAAKNTPISAKCNADTVEAILGAVFLDSGRDLSQVTRLVEAHVLKHPGSTMCKVSSAARLEASLTAFIRSQVYHPDIASFRPGKLVKDWQADLQAKGRQAEEFQLTAHLTGNKLSALGQLVSVIRRRILNEQESERKDSNNNVRACQVDSERVRQKRQRPLNTLIVGASSGIGAALARRLSTRGAHVSLCLVGRRSSALNTVAEHCRSLGAGVTVVPGDISNDADVRRICSHFTDTIRDSAALPVVVCNAGIGAPGSTAEIDAASCGAVLSTNVTGVMLALREVMPVLSRTPASQVVVTGSVLGLRPPSRGGNVVYTASKHAVEGVVNAVRTEFAGTGVKIGVVNPGGVRTDWFDDPRKGGYSEEDRPDTSKFLNVEEVVDALLAIIDQDATTDIRQIVLENHIPK